ncbi:Mor transcription activator family protein [Pseudomonas sp. nanlin1]|uniref:Mor transcription activator family protein n=1 Tax=Pseudomonas sp. nanlin1 TaxID=3040605 RepID=UPI00388F0462
MDINELNRVDTRQLPRSLQMLIECIGVEQAYRLTRLYGGRPKYIPKNPQRTALAKALPPDALAALIKRFAGLALEIPKVDHFLRQLRNQKIQEESSNGCSRSTLADKYGLSLRQIGNIRRTANG